MTDEQEQSEKSEDMKQSEEAEEKVKALEDDLPEKLED